MRVTSLPGAFYTVPDQARVQAMQEYMILRQQGETERDAFRQVASSSIYAAEWKDEDRWELAFRAAASLSLLVEDDLRHDVMLQKLLARKDQVDAILMMLGDEATEQGEGRFAAAREYLKYSQEVDRIVLQVQDFAKQAATRFSENSSLPVWVERRQEIIDALAQTYQGKGPQYDMLCEQLADVKVMIEQMQSNPAAVDVGDYAKLNQTMILHTNQLQRYTEATKSETIRTEVQDAMVRLLGIIEQHVAPSYPSLWNVIVKDIVQRAGGGQVIDQIVAPEEDDEDGDFDRVLDEALSGE